MADLSETKTFDYAEYSKSIIFCTALPRMRLFTLLKAYTKHNKILCMLCSKGYQTKTAILP